MSSDRRIFLKRLAGSSTGLILGGPFWGRSIVSQFSDFGNKKEGIGKENVVFPFFKYVGKYNIGDYIPKDQGGKFIQMELMKTEEDKQIIEMVRNGLLEEVYGNPIEWNRFESGAVEKSVWLNRFYFLPSFARLFYLTGDPSYLNDMMQKISVWIKENPLLPDSHLKTYSWRDMQVAWRSIHWSWCYFLTEKSLSQEQKNVITDSLREHASALLEGFGKQLLNEFNHQSHGALAMLYLGVLFPMFEQADELRQTALKILAHHLDKAFYDDGGNKEQMFGYYPFETHIFRDTYFLCSHNHLDFPSNLLPMLEKMAIFLSSVSQPDGTMPPVNDSYEMPIEPTLAVVNEILDNRIDIQAKSSKYFPQTQIGVMRGNDLKNNWYVLVNPAKTIGGHAHAGRLAFTLWMNGHAVLVDSGCSNYDNPKLVSWYRTSQAHNTVLIDGKSDEATSSDLLWAPKRNTENRITHWEENDSSLFCRMISPAREAVNNSVSWSRSLVLVKNEFLILHDCFVSPDEHSYEILFHFPPVRISEQSKYKSLLVFGKSSLALVPANPNLIEKLTVADGLVSIQGEGIPSPIARIQFAGKGVVHSVVAFIPEIDRLSQIKIHQETTADGVGVTISKGKTGQTVLLMRNPEAEELTVLGHHTRQMFAVF